MGGGLWTEELSWEVRRAGTGEVVASGSGAGAFSGSCGDCAVYTVAMSDSWGDGWTGNTLEMYSCADRELLVSGLTVSPAQGYSATYEPCLDPALAGGVEVRVGGGTWQGEVSWAVTLPDGSTMMGAGGGVTRSADCPEGDFSDSYESPPAPTVSPAPVLMPTKMPTVDCGAGEAYMVEMFDSYGDGA